MLAKRVIPCLDVDGGRVVKGTKFQDLRDAGDPVELAAHYDREGADELVFLDITATVEGRTATLDVIAQTAEQVFIPLTVGGGVQTDDDVNELLRAGADKVSLNSAAVRDPALLQRCADRFGTQCMVVAIDAKRRPDADEPGPRPGRSSSTRAEPAPDATPSGGRWKPPRNEARARCLLTSMDRDGTGDGYDLALLRAIGERRAGSRDRQRRRRRTRSLRGRAHRGRRRRGARRQHAALRPAHDRARSRTRSPPTTCR